MPWCPPIICGGYVPRAPADSWNCGQYWTLYIPCFFLCIHTYDELLPYHLNGALCSFSLAYQNYLHHFFCTFGPLLSKTRVAWSQSLWYHYSQSYIWDVYKMTNEWVHWTKEWFISSVDGAGDWLKFSILSSCLICRLEGGNQIKNRDFQKRRCQAEC